MVTDIRQTCPINDFTDMLSSVTNSPVFRYVVTSRPSAPASAQKHGCNPFFLVLASNCSLTEFFCSTLLHRGTSGHEATFTDSLYLDETTFTDSLYLDKAAFTDSLYLGEAAFTYSLYLDEAAFTDSLYLDEAAFTDSLYLDEAAFLQTPCI
ncbi:hypothetical protein CEXT_277831 [Caerostris extrusa]|uniref:Uncharacterized protein n=1 Tax=Caerostris extrusa TaxID=172846 RepID=A0AAV4TVQ7_CAEEX|nr:hypothetical protein CEXT_277831 [Caerostris extrusa]